MISLLMCLFFIYFVGAGAAAIINILSGSSGSLTELLLDGVPAGFAFAPLTLLILEHTIGRKDPWGRGDIPSLLEQQDPLQAAGVISWILGASNALLLMLGIRGETLAAPAGHIDIWCSVIGATPLHFAPVEWVCAVMGAVLAIVVALR